MKRIVVLCDGTWNETDDATPTNVVRLAQALAPRNGDGVAQIPVHIDGVGTGEGITWISRFLDKKLGGALGWGLTANVLEAYRNLVFLHEPGDELYVFGFSRGACTARSLAGFLRSTGILPRTAPAPHPRGGPALPNDGPQDDPSPDGGEPRLPRRRDGLPRGHERAGAGVARRK